MPVCIKSRVRDYGLLKKASFPSPKTFVQHAGKVLEMSILPPTKNRSVEPCEPGVFYIA